MNNSSALQKPGKEILQQPHETLQRRLQTPRVIITEKQGQNSTHDHYCLRRKDHRSRCVCTQNILERRHKVLGTLWLGTGLGRLYNVFCTL